MGTYRVLQNKIKEKGDQLEVVKNIYSEYLSIALKKKLYSNVIWTDEQQKEFDEYWIHNYGKRISNKWHRLYQNINGVFNVEYFPEHLFSIKLSQKLNPRSYSELFSDKNLLHTLFDSVNGLKIPETYICAVKGRLFDNTGNIISTNQAINIMSKLDCCVIKPTIETGSGSGVIVCSDNSEIGNIDIIQQLINHKGNFVIQEKISVCKEMSILAPNCVSTFRIMTFITDDGIHHAPVAMRIGTGTSRIDNIHAGGLVIAVDDSGYLYKNAYRLGYGDKSESFISHPDSGIVFENYYVPQVDSILKIAEICHRKIPQLDLVSWDFTVDKDENVVLIEANTNDHSIWFPQMVSSKAIFGEYTGYFIKKIRK